jgi:hypothetical protein
LAQRDGLGNCQFPNTFRYPITRTPTHTQRTWVEVRSLTLGLCLSPSPCLLSHTHITHAHTGGLRILPHKSWNVYNFDNRERVRKDEEKARETEAERQERAEAAEAEARIEVLRARAKGARSGKGEALLDPAADELREDGEGGELSRRLSVSLYLCLPHCTHTHTHTHTHTRTHCFCLSVSVYLSLSLCLCLSVCLSVCLSLSLSHTHTYIHNLRHH